MIGVLGLGKLGLPFALALAAAGHDLAGWDVDEDIRVALAVGRSPITEAGVDRLLADNPIQLVEPERLAISCEVVFVIVPTPSLPSGRFDTTYVEQAMRSLRPFTHGLGRPPICAVVSTVSPGDCRRRLLPLATKLAMPFVYCPTLIALGSVVHDLRNAEIQIIGFHATDPAGYGTVADVLKRMARDARPMPMTLESAELAKIATNVFMATKIAFANQLGQLAHEWGADVDDIVLALGAQSMIGARGITPGASFGGPCLPRDVHAYAELGGSLGQVAHAMNEEHLQWVLSRCGLGLDYRLATFTILGRPYKEGTTYRIESFGDRLASSLAGVLVELPATEVWQADLVIIALPCMDLRIQPKTGARVLDLWRTHGYLAHAGVDYVPFGKPR